MRIALALLAACGSSHEPPQPDEPAPVWKPGQEPHESPLRFKQIVSAWQATCGLTEAGEMRCWGKTDHVAMLTGTYKQIAMSLDITCGIRDDDTASCASTYETAHYDKVPTDKLMALAVANGHACALRTNGTPTCWGVHGSGDGFWADTFVEITAVDQAYCARKADGTAMCSNGGVKPPYKTVFDSLAVGGATGGRMCGIVKGKAHCWPVDIDIKSDSLVYLACSGGDVGCCGIDREHKMHCDNIDRIGPAPLGTFDTVAIFKDHACAERTEPGGTVCWGDDHVGQSDVPTQ